MHHHHILSDNYHPRYFDKVSMRYFHRPRNKFTVPMSAPTASGPSTPTMSRNPSWLMTATPPPLTGVAPLNYFEILGQDALTGWFRY